MEYREIEEKAHCLECGSEIQYYRKGKQFCTDSCRFRYHNKSKSKSRHYQSIVNGALSRNYMILKELYEKGVKSMSLGDLVTSGFQPMVCTGYTKDRSHSEYHCYEYKYYLSSSRLFGLDSAL